MTARFSITLGATLLAAAAYFAAAGADDTSPDLILTNASVYTGGAVRAQALAVRGARIVAVGSNAEILALSRAPTRVVDVGGHTVIPGINDAHMHWSPTPDSTSLEIESMEPSWEVVLAALAKATAQAPRGGWIRGTFGAAVLDDARARREALDRAAPENPVLLEAWTGHGALLNTLAQRGLGLADRPAAAPDGRVGRDGEERFDGWLFEYPQWRATAGLSKLVTRPQALRQLQEWAAQAAAFGITSTQLMPGMPADEFATLLRDASVGLRVRMIHAPMARGEVAVPRVADGERVRASGVKWILDGTPVERGAAIRGAYADRPGERGRLNHPADFVAETLRSAAARREQPLFHCAGDRCAETVLSAMESQLGVDWPALRVRIEHGDGVLDDLAPRAARLGVVVVQNPTHFTIGDLMRARLGAGQHFMPLRSLRDAGVPLALGSDGPMNPFLNLMLAAAHPARPEEALSREQALEAYTLGSAFAEHAEGEKGQLAAGRLADIAVLSQDVLTVPADALPGTTSLLTIVGGRVVYDAGRLTWRVPERAESQGPKPGP